MREQIKSADPAVIDLGAASEVTLGIDQTDAFEELNGEDYKDS